MQLTPHFALYEVLRNSGADQLPGDLLQPAREHAAVLENVRAALGGRKMVPSSWYRTPEGQDRIADAGYNPSDTSQHLTARATDFAVEGMTPHQVMAAIHARGAAALGIDQAIEYSGHVHIGTRPGYPRGQMLVARGPDKYETWQPATSAPYWVPANEAGTPPKYSPVWWVALTVGVVDLLRRFLS